MKSKACMVSWQQACILHSYPLSAVCGVMIYIGFGIDIEYKAKKKNKFVSGRWSENLNAKSSFFFVLFCFFFFWRGAKVNFQVNIHIIIHMVDEFVPSYVPFPMQLLLQSIYLLNICAFMHKYAKL